jgi:hypothetical protein
MARLLINDEWYESLASSSYYETDFEGMLFQHASKLFPEYFLVPFKGSVYGDEGPKRPDAALIERQYRSWWVVEIELANHSIGHVLEQISVFSEANYGEDDARRLKRREPSLDDAALTAMMKGAPPGVLVVVNGPRPDWVTPLKQWGALLAIVETFRSDANHHVLRVNGEYPTAPSDVLTGCRPDRFLPRALLVESPANLPNSLNGRLVIDYEGSVSEWQVIETKDRVWINPIGTSPLPGNKRVALVRGEDGRLMFRRER